MSSTRHTLLWDLFPRLAGNAHKTSLRGVHYNETVRVSLSATAEVAIASFGGKVRIHRVYIVSDAALATDATNFLQFKIEDKSTDGTGTTQLGSTVSTHDTALAAFDQLDLYNPSTEVYLAPGKVLSLTGTKNGAAANVTGLLVVEYSPVIS